MLQVLFYQREKIYPLTLHFSSKFISLFLSQKSHVAEIHFPSPTSLASRLIPQNLFLERWTRVVVIETKGSYRDLVDLLAPSNC